MKKNRVKLQIKTYLYVIVTFALLFVSFLSFMEIDAYIAYASDGNDVNQFESVIKVYEEQYEEIFESEEDYVSFTNDLRRKTAIIGGDDDEMTQFVYNHLGNLREECYIVSSMSEISVSLIEDTDVYIVTDKDLTSDDVIQIIDGYKKDKTVVFLNVINEDLFSDKDVQEKIGVRNYVGENEFEGLRVSSDLSFTHMQEQVETEFLAHEVVLTGNTKIYANVLIEDSDIKNEDLPPLMWRYVSDDGSIFVCNGDLFEDQISYSVLTELYAQLTETYIYPVVNAYVFLINGMPYVENFASEFLISVFHRDAIGMQDSIFFPQFTSSQDRYQSQITWYTPEYEAVIDSDDQDMIYNLNQMEINSAELAKFENDKLISDTGLLNEAVLWDTDFSFIDNEEDMLNLPIILDAYDYENEVIDSNAILRGTGFMSLYIDAERFLTDPTSDWVEFCLQYESVLGAQLNLYPWIDRLTASAAAQRVTTFLTIEPSYYFRENQVDIEIDNFNVEAYFMLDTSRTIKEIEGGKIRNIGKNLYLVEAQSDFVMIRYEEEI